MFKIPQGFLFLLLGMISIQASANNMITYSTVSEEVVIPGYTPPPADTSASPTQPAPDSNQPSSTRPMDSSVLEPPTSEQSQTLGTVESGCQKFIAPGMSINMVKTNLEDQFLNAVAGHTFKWKGLNGQTDTIISFMDTGQPVEVQGSLPASLAARAKTLSFTLDDARNAFPDSPQLIGGLYSFSAKDGNGSVIVYTDLKNMVTKFSTTAACKPAEKQS